MNKPAMRMTVKGGTVRLTMPAKVANELGALQAGLKSLADRLGHPSCATGCDILHLMLERDFILSESMALNAHAFPLHPVGLPQDPIPLRTITVSIPERVSNDIKGLTKAIETVVGKLGCSSCCSGFDILFQREIDMLAIDENLSVTGFGRFR